MQGLWMKLSFPELIWKSSELIAIFQYLKQVLNYSPKKLIEEMDSLSNTGRKKYRIQLVQYEIIIGEILIEHLSILHMI